MSSTDGTTRRSVLKGMTGMAVSNVLRPLAAGLAGAGLAGCCHEKITLNVILHGLFVLDFQDDHIDLLAPNVDGHIYKAGNWDYWETYCLEEPKKVKYELTGVTGRSKPPRVSRDFMAVLSKQEISQDNPTFKIKQELSRIHLKLPFPDEIHPLRSLRVEPYGGKDSKYIKCDGLSLCQVLVYQNAQTTASLTNCPWHTKKNKSDNRTATLHIWAEPDKRVDPGHECYAYDQLKEMTGLRIYLTTKESPPIDCCVDLPGIEPFEEQGWAEWSSGGEGTRPVNCNSHTFV